MPLKTQYSALSLKGVRPVGFDRGAADMRHVRAGHQIFAATGDAEFGAVETGLDAAHDLHRIQVNLEN